MENSYKEKENYDEVLYSSPMVIAIRNFTDEKQEYNLFGFNKFSKKENYGNPQNIEVKALTGASYDEYVNNTCGKSLETHKFRFQSSNRKNIQGHFFHHNYDVGKGIYVRKEINLAIMMDAYQQQCDIIDVTLNWELSSSNYLSGIIQPESTLVVSIYTIYEGMKTPRLSGKNVSPVIIQTTQDVKGVSATIIKTKDTKAENKKNIEKKHKKKELVNLRKKGVAKDSSDFKAKPKKIAVKK